MSPQGMCIWAVCWMWLDVANDVHNKITNSFKLIKLDYPEIDNRKCTFACLISIKGNNIW